MRHGLPQLMFSGVTFWPLDPRADEVHISDIAHHLSNLCRFTGGTASFYSVAQHSVHVHDMLLDEYGPAIAAWGLLHDASEAYLGDVARPTKYALEGFGDAYRVVEARLMRVIAERFNLVPATEPSVVKVADDRMLATELRDLMPRTSDPRFDASEFVGPYEWGVETWSPEVARTEFLTRFYQRVHDGALRETWHAGVAA